MIDAHAKHGLMAILTEGLATTSPSSSRSRILAPAGRRHRRGEGHGVKASDILIGCGSAGLTSRGDHRLNVLKTARHHRQPFGSRLAAAFNSCRGQRHSHGVAGARERIGGIGQIGEFCGSRLASFEHEKRSFKHRLRVAATVANYLGIVERRPLEHVPSRCLALPGSYRQRSVADKAGVAR